ncbi:Rsp5p-dependent ubiquitination, sorting of cargo proteins at the multivesicular body [Borealophlyctis nickersoniae]|nr:Rsp5p-dependent ubiquitination, sorting of cargo proteins at the multivesicular body [Borealophlyctis nickersoniae]
MVGYFEVTFVSKPTVRTPLVRIGLAKESFSYNHPLGSFADTVAYQSTDGFICLGHCLGQAFQFGPAFSEGDTIGCGYAIEPSTSSSPSHVVVFFTLNGAWIGDAPYMIRDEPHLYRCDWHAAVNSTGPCTLRINVGQSPFSYAPANGVDSLTSFYVTDRVLPTPSDHETTLIKQWGLASWSMTPNVLHILADPYLPPTTDGRVILFPDNGSNVARNCLSELPFYWADEGHGCNNWRFFYFEVDVLTEGSGDNSFVSIGVATKPYSPFHQIGWDAYSIAYHSDDGNTFNTAHQSGTPYSTPYGAGTVIGCGYIPTTGTIFFTRNGTRLPDAATGVFLKLYPAVGAIRAWSVRVNFGQEVFLYAPANGVGVEDGVVREGEEVMMGLVEMEEGVQESGVPLSDDAVHFEHPILM